MAKIWFPSGQSRLPSTFPERGIEGVESAAARLEVESGGVPGESRNDPRGPREGDAGSEGEPASPSGKAGDGAVAAVFDEPDLSVPAVRDPEPAFVEARGVRTGESARDRLPRSARENDAAAVDGEIAVARFSRPDLVGRCREEGLGEVLPRGDGVELDVVSIEERSFRGVDRARPPGLGEPARRLDAHHQVLPDRVRMEHAADEGQVVEIRAAGVEARTHRDEAARTGDRTELDDLVRVPSRSQVQDSSLAVVDQARGVGKTKKRPVRTSVLHGERDDQVLVLAGHEERRLEPVRGHPRSRRERGSGEARGRASPRPPNG